MTAPLQGDRTHAPELSWVIVCGLAAGREEVAALGQELARHRSHLGRVSVETGCAGCLPGPKWQLGTSMRPASHTTLIEFLPLKLPVSFLRIRRDRTWGGRRESREEAFNMGRVS